jgi:hypothetical protein
LLQVVDAFTTMGDGEMVAAERCSDCAWFDQTGAIAIGCFSTAALST